MADDAERSGVAGSRAASNTPQWVARCDRCGASSALDRQRMAALEAMGVSFRRLEDQLRCTCGARRGSLVRWPPSAPEGRRPPVPVLSRGRILD
jgi:hypothetical protein